MSRCAIILREIRANRVDDRAIERCCGATLRRPLPDHRLRGGDRQRSPCGARSARERGRRVGYSGEGRGERRRTGCVACSRRDRRMRWSRPSRCGLPRCLERTRSGRLLEHQRWRASQRPRGGRRTDAATMDTFRKQPRSLRATSPFACFRRCAASSSQRLRTFESRGRAAVGRGEEQRVADRDRQILQCVWEHGRSCGSRGPRVRTGGGLGDSLAPGRPGLRFRLYAHRRYRPRRCRSGGHAGERAVAAASPPAHGDADHAA